MNVLITGGAGFIGSNLANALAERGNTVHILDNLSNGSLSNLNLLNEKIKFHKGTITDTPAIEGALEGCTTVFHEAAEISVSGSLKNPKKTQQVNVLGTRNVLEACRKKDVQKVILASSAAVYGDEPTLPKSEESPLEPKSPYAESKIQNELDARTYFENYGLETVCLRYFNVYGPNQNPMSPYSGVISKFIDCVISEKRPMFYGDGNQTRDFVFVGDVVSANLLAAEKKGIGGEIFNIATGVETSILGLWQNIEEVSNYGTSPTFSSSREGDIVRSVASIKKAEHILGYKPKHSITEGLKKTLEWMKNGN